MKVEVAKKTPGQAPKKVPKMSEEKQRKVWAVVLCSLAVMIVGLGVAIGVVLTVRGGGGKSGCRDDAVEASEDEKAEFKKQEDMKEYILAHNAIDEVLKASTSVTQSTVIGAYQYYIAESENSVVRNMLRADLLEAEMRYDTGKTRGDEFIAVAIDIDKELQTSNSAALVITIVTNYGKTELYDEYESIFNERLIAEGYNPDEETKG